MINVITHSINKVKISSLQKLNLTKDIAWIDAYNPDQDELKQLYEKTGISIFELVKCTEKRAIPKIIPDIKYTTIIFAAPNEGITLPFGIFISKRFILTTHSERVPALEEIRSKLLKTNKVIKKFNLSLLIYSIILETIKDYTTSLDQIENKLDKIEELIFKHATEEEVKIVFSLKRKLLYFRRSLVFNHNVIYELQRGASSFIEQSNITNFSNLSAEINQIISDVDLHRERLTQVIDMYMSAVSNKMNDSMKSFTIIASLLLLPMLISGIWGMNFDIISFPNRRLSILFPIILMIIGVLLMFIFFKRKKWL